MIFTIFASEHTRFSFLSFSKKTSVCQVSFFYLDYFLTVFSSSLYSLSIFSSSVCFLLFTSLVLKCQHVFSHVLFCLVLVCFILSLHVSFFPCHFSSLIWTVLLHLFFPWLISMCLDPFSIGLISSFLKLFSSSSVCLLSVWSSFCFMLFTSLADEYVLSVLDSLHLV